MLHLQARVQLQKEVVVVLRVVQVLHGARAHVPDVLHQLLGLELHVREDFRGRNTSTGFGRRSFFKNLLEAALGRTISPIKSDGVAVLVADHLHFQMARAGHQLHDEDRRPGLLLLHLGKGGFEFGGVLAHADALAAAALRRLQHHGVLDSLRRLQRLRGTMDTPGLKGLLRNGPVRL